MRKARDKQKPKDLDLNVLLSLTLITIGLKIITLGMRSIGFIILGIAFILLYREISKYRRKVMNV